MIELPLDALADVVGGDLVGGEPDATVTSVTIDSREATAGALFVPLAGERTDGHEHVGDALARGASAYLWSADRNDPPASGAVVVDDTADALVGLGRWVRDTVDPLVIAITGSSGKTTTKDLIAAAAGSGRRVIANVGSYNNELGVPLTCCRLEADTEVLVAEAGARGSGHIAHLSSLLSQDVAVVTMVGAAHLEMFGDLDGVAVAKRELVEALDADGVAVLNADDPRVAAMASAAAGDVITYGVREPATWGAAEVTLDDLACPSFTVLRDGARTGVDVRLRLPGEHNVGNALAALAVADLAGVELAAAAAALADASVSRWRMELLRTRGGVTVLNDAYNANPSSMAAALATLRRLGGVEGRRFAVLGQMAELGPGGADEHVAVGRTCAELALAGLVVVGGEAAGIAEGALAGGLDEAAVIRVDGAGDVADALAPRLRAGDVVLVKASRSVGLERVAEALEEGGA